MEKKQTHVQLNGTNKTRSCNCNLRPAARKLMHPVEVSTLAFGTCHQSEPFLESRNCSAINQVLREAVTNVHHPKNRTRMQGVVILYYEYVPVELFIILIRAHRSKYVALKRQQTLKHWVALAEYSLMQ